jgi:hypothetical protein
MFNFMYNIDTFVRKLLRLRIRVLINKQRQQQQQQNEKDSFEAYAFLSFLFF